MAPKNSSRKDHYIIAIGASAGGLEAIHEFFDHMPESSDASYVIIQHLSPDYKSLLVDLVSRHTHMKVFEAEDNISITKNCIYVIPNNKFISLSKNKLVLSNKPSLKVANNAIDVFLYSLAKEKKKQAIAVILSGTGTDGTKGIKAIKDEGGLVIVQEPESAKFDGMPNSAIISGNVDYVLKTSQMPKEITSYISNRLEDDEAVPDHILLEIFELIQRHAGFDFHYYKTPTITRRIARRITEGNFESIEAYLDFLRINPDECKQLGKEFLISVTRFFRDKEAFDFIREEVFPKIIEQKEAGELVKMWVCACSTGEEAYSLAIVLDLALQASGKTLPVKIFASDLEKANVDIASRGMYPLSIEKDIEPTILERYFTKHKEGFQIVPRIRKQIVFAQHNVIKDPPFIKNDFVSCRNMLIYMNNTLQQRVYAVLLFSVIREGYLFLGTSENVNTIKNHLREIHQKWKIYKKVSDARIGPHLGEVQERRQVVKQNPKPYATPAEDTKRQRSLWDDFKDTLVTDFNFAAFYIDRNFEIKEAIGNFDKILSLPKKILKLNLLRMLPPNISSVLITEIKNAWKDNVQQVSRNIHYKQNDHDVAMHIVVKTDHPANGKAFTLVAFHFMQFDEMMTTEPINVVYPDPQQSDYVIALEEELHETKGNLQHAIEDLETANEELQSSNEELLSANEELQSSNEELQSLNEELHTLNTEHQIKIQELVELNDDLNNYFRSSDIGQIFLDKNLTIRKYNPASAGIINLIESDIGRPISHISVNFQYKGMLADIEQVMKHNVVVEREVQLINGKNLLMRVMPYLSQENRNGGIIISFIDITTITNLNNIVRGVFNSSLSAIVALKAVRNGANKIVDYSILTINNRAETWLSVRQENLKGKLLTKEIGNSAIASMFEKFRQVVDDDATLHLDLFDEKDRKWFEVTAVKMMDGLVATFSDITQKKLSDERLKKNYVELISTRENLRKLNAQLEEKVAERTRLLSESEERFRLVASATNDVIWDWSFIDSKVWLSEAFYSRFGFAKDAEGFTRQRWVELIHPDDRKVVEEELYRAINSGQRQWNKEFRFQKADGTYANILDRSYILHDDYQTPYRMLGSMFDMTELKQAEREVESNIAQRKFLAESMPLMVLTCRADGKVDSVNKQFEAYTGLQESEALEDRWFQIIHDDDIPMMQDHWQRVITSGEDLQVELRIQKEGNSYRWNLLRAKARKDELNRVISWVVTTVDIHEQKLQHEKLEQKVIERTIELHRINHALEISNHELQQFASVASHDLQEPLRKIHLFAGLVKDRYPENLDGAAQYLDKIMHSSMRMKAIIKNILQFSRLSVDDISFEPTDFNKIISEILEDLEVLREDKQATFDIDRFPVIEAIPGQIHQVFLNVIANALKFSKPHIPAKIKIAATRVAEKKFDSHPDNNGSYCLISISDNGIGFDEKFAHNIFVLFQRLHSKDQYEGTGIGLAIVKKIVEKHKGIITASGKEQQGAVFTIVLPITQEAVERQTSSSGQAVNSELDLK